jgi:AcrR family transcriptional regulator
MSADSTLDIPAVRPVRQGVFFTAPDALPRGRHKLSREQIRAAQRERMMAAMTELLAANGYRGFGPGDVATRAGVSLGAFYDCFDNKDTCIFAGYDRFIEVLITRMAAIDVDGKDRREIVEAVLGAYLKALESDPVVARAYQVEIDALGAPARERRRNSLTQVATFIRELVARLEPDGKAPPELPWTAYIGSVYAARQLASDELDGAAEPDLMALGDDMEIWLSDLYRARGPGA